MSDSKERLSIGIDLGTTYSCVGIHRFGNVEIIANESGSRITPSCVAFNDDERLIGCPAATQANVNPTNTIFEAKRLIGRRFNDATVQKNIKKWPFEVFDDDGAPKIEVQYMNETKIFTPEQISAMVLRRMKDIADTFICGEVCDAVITVPAYFTDSQRQATKDAGEVAGLNVLKIINEPTAAAIAYGVGKKITSRQNVMIYDLGGGTFDVAILTISKGVFKVKAVGGDTHLGGGDFDNRLLNHFLAAIHKRHEVDLSTNKRALGRLRSACEAAKVQLSSSLKAPINIDCLFGNTNFNDYISRGKFEMLCNDLFDETLEHVTTTLEQSGLGKHDIHEVLLVGGSTRIPKIQQMLQVFFDGKRLNMSIHPDEAVAYGAAIQAAILSNDDTVDHMRLEDVTPFTLSVDNPDGTLTTVIKRNTKIPVAVTKGRTTVYDYQTVAQFLIYEGEQKRKENNHLLGKFRLRNIEEAPKYVPSIQLTYEIDANGILHASAIDSKTSSTNSVTISSNKGRLRREEIDRMVAEAAEFSRHDRNQNLRDLAREELQQYCSKNIKSSKAPQTILSKENQSSLSRWCTDALEWLDDNDNALLEDYQQKLDELKTKCEPINVAMELCTLRLDPPSVVSKTIKTGINNNK